MVRIRSIVIIVFMLTINAFAGGIIAGTVVDENDVPLVGATVMLEGTPYGAMTSREGEYVIAGLEKGTYTVVARMVGRATSRVEQVTVEEQQLSQVDFMLEIDASGSTVISVVQTRTHILRDVPATVYNLDFSEMKTMSADAIVDYLATEPGVVQQDGELHIRGGRAGEVDYRLDGVSLRSPMDNRFNFDLPISAIDNATLMTGGLSIEYGNTLSGVVDIVGKEGGTTFSGQAYGRMGDASSGMISTGERVFAEAIDVDMCRTDLRSVEFSLSGQELFTQNLLPQIGIQLPGEFRISASGQFNVSGDNLVDTRDNWSYNWINDGSAIVKLTYRPEPNTLISLSTIGSYREHGWNQWAWSKYGRLGLVEGEMYSPGSQDYALPAMFSETAGLIMNYSHLINEKISTKLTLGTVRFQDMTRIYSEDGQFVGEGANPIFWLTQFSPALLIQDQDGFFYNGIHQNVWNDTRSTVSSALLGVDINPNPRVRFKIGISAKYYDLYQYNAYYLSPGSAYMSLWEAFPFSTSAYSQGSFRFSGGAITTLGLRADYFDPNTSVFSLEAGGGVEAEAKMHISPRISFSVPFSERSLFYTTYGHYFQMPPMSCLYLQTSFNCGSERVIAGNPDLDPELTQLFEVGIRQELDSYSDLSIAFYNKEVTGLVSTENHNESNNFIFINDNSHGNVKGIEAGLTRSPGGHLSGKVWYTFSMARGRYSSMLNNYNNSQHGYVYVSKEDSYLDWDQPHQAAFSVAYTTFPAEGPEVAGLFPFENTTSSVSMSYGSGTPYSLPPSGSEIHVTNSERRPYTMQTDLMLSRKISVGSTQIQVMGGIYNLFNRRNIVHIYDTSVFHSSGDPTGEMANPRAWSPARHFLLSAMLSW